MISIGNNTKIKNSIIGSKNNKEIKRLQQELQRKDNNWNELKEFLENNYKETQDIWYVKIINKMRELENEN